MNDDHFYEVTLRFAVKADTEDTAFQIVNEEMYIISDFVADHFVYEWTSPRKYEDHKNAQAPL